MGNIWVATSCGGHPCEGAHAEVIRGKAQAGQGASRGPPWKSQGGGGGLEGTAAGRTYPSFKSPTSNQCPPGLFLRNPQFPTVTCQFDAQVPRVPESVVSLSKFPTGTEHGV